MKTRSAVVATVVAASLAGTAVGYAADRVATPSTSATPSAASTALPRTSVPTPMPPATPTQVHTATAEPVTTTAHPPATRPGPTATPRATPARPTTTTPRVTSPEWDVTSLLTAADLARAGLRSPSAMHRAAGIGQSAFGECDSDLPFYTDARNFFRADEYFDTLGVHGGQLTTRFADGAAAKRAVERIISGRTACHPGSVDRAPDWTSSPVRRFTLTGDAAGIWSVSSASKKRQEVTVLVRSGAYLSAITLSGPTGFADRVDLDALAAASGRRLP